MYDYSVFFTDVINGPRSPPGYEEKRPEFKMPSYVNYLYDSSGITILTNGLPNYIPTMFGLSFDNSNQSIEWSSIYLNNKFSRDSNPNKLTFNAVRYRFNIPDMNLKDRRLNDDVQDYGYLTPMAEIGVAINGVAFYNALGSVDIYTKNRNNISSTDWLSNTQSLPGPQSLLQWIVAGREVYYLDAINIAEQFSSCCGHNSNKQYHYHKLPYCVSGTNALHPDDISNLDDIYTFYKEQNNNNQHSPIIGWLLDGYPVYGPIGYKYTYSDSGSVAAQETDGQKETLFKRSSYSNIGVLNDASGNITQAFGSVSSTQLARYTGYKFDSNFITGDDKGIYLDHCNGIFGPTPEFPDGIYHYHATIDIDSSGEPVRGLDYYYPYDLDNLVKIYDPNSFAATNEQITVIKYLNEKIDGYPSVFVEQDDLNRTWTKWLQLIYDPQTFEEIENNVYTPGGPYAAGTAEAQAVSNEDKIYYSYTDWDNANETGGLITFWLRDNGNLGYKNLKLLFPLFFDKIESIVPVFPFITSILRGSVINDPDNPGVALGHEVQQIDTNSEQSLKDEWVNAAAPLLVDAATGTAVS